MTIIAMIFAAAFFIGLICQEIRYQDMRRSRDHYAISYSNIMAEESERNRKMTMALRAVCDRLTPSPLETMSDEVAQQLVDTFHNSSYRN